MLCVILSGISSNNLVAQDSTNILNKSELRQSYKLFTELQFRRIQTSKQGEQINIQREIIKRKDIQIELKEQIEENLRKQIEIIEPAWYDNFNVGVGVGIIAVSAIIFLVK